MIARQQLLSTVDSPVQVVLGLLSSEAWLLALELVSTQFSVA
jgi:hypothetical protein